VKVLVTGATGFIGHHVVSRLLERGHAVTASARNEAKAQSYPWFSRVQFVRCDVHRPSSTALKYFGRQDAAMHLAWSGLPNYSSRHHCEENLAADRRFLEALVQAGISQLLVTGTCLEYGFQSGALSEDAITAPVVPYALAKDALHKFLQSLRQQRAFVLQWARLFYIYGPGQHPNSLISQLDRAIGAGDTVFNMSRGDQLRDYLPVEEVARRLVSLLEHPECTGATNICSGEPISVQALVEQQLANRGAKIALNLGYYPYPSYEPMAFWGDGRKYTTNCKHG
jgi:dTDP-6-deoxy-L-talose 4-dehydrogenase (NAD+)